MTPRARFAGGGATWLRLLCVLAGATGVAAMVFAWPSVRLKWYTESLRSEFRHEPFLASRVGLLPHSLFRDAGGDGIAWLATLLDDDDLHVWVEAGTCIDTLFDGASEPQALARVLAVVRAQGELAALRYLLLPRNCHSTEWRHHGVPDGNDLIWDRWGYWSGVPGQFLESTPELIAECRRCIDLKWGESTPPRTGDLESLPARAADALLAMWQPERGLPEDVQVRECLEHAARTLEEPDERVAILAHLLCRKAGLGRDAGDFVPRVLSWEIDLKEGKLPREEFDSIPGAPPEPPLELALSALLYVDHPRTRAIHEALSRSASMREAMRTALGRVDLQLDMPRPPWILRSLEARASPDES